MHIKILELTRKGRFLSYAHVIGLPPGEYVGEYKGMNWFLCPWAGENSRDCFDFEGKGWGNSKFCKFMDANYEDIRGIFRFIQLIILVIKWQNGEFSDENTRFRAA